MPNATTKAQLIAVCEKDYAKLATALAGIDNAIATQAYEDGITIKDIVAHRAHWIDLYLGWWADGQAGRTVHMPAEGYGWGDLKAYNAQLRDRYADLTWPEACARLAARHAALMAHLGELDDAALYAAPMVGGNGKWTAGRYAEAAGASHYRSALKFIRACLRKT